MRKEFSQVMRSEKMEGEHIPGDGERRRPKWSRMRVVIVDIG